MKKKGSYIPDAHTKFYIDRSIETMGIPYLCSNVDNLLPKL